MSPSSVSTGSAHALLSFERHEGGLGVVDHIERRRCEIHTGSGVDLRDVPVDEFYFPVDRGVEMTARHLTIPHTMPVYVRNHAGWMVAELTHGDSQTLPVDIYSIELSAPIKLYVSVESELTVSVTSDRVRIEFDGETPVRVGARSYHERPAATITTTSDPEDVMTAVSHLGSALKTTTCERSYPTLRGHPPTIELGDSLDVPPVIERPETGVTIELPSDHRSAFVVAPLAYYLGAEVVPGDEPRIVTDSGFTHPLDDPVRGFEGEVERVLKQTFFLDCVTRTEGYYQVDLHERDRIEDDVDLDFGALYDQPIAAQLPAYLDVPYSAVEPLLPEWKLTAHVAPRPEHVEMLPFLVNDLAVVRIPDARSIDASERAATVDRFVRGGEFARRSRRSAESVETPPLVRLDEADSLEQAWIGDGIPVGASKAMIEAFRHRIDRDPTDGDIDITVVCNDTAMDGERGTVNEVYGSREELPFDVDVHHDLRTDELREIIEGEMDFFHYIGHIDAEGFECSDGTFDAATLSHTGIDAFFLNACTSYQQGRHLIEAGSIAGVVTLEDVVNSGAERVGGTLARLLNRGFPLRAALNIAKSQSLMGGHYLVIGDGGIDIAQSESGIPSLCEVKTTKEGYRLIFNTHPTKDRGLGSVTIPFVGQNERYFLTSGMTGEFKLTKDELLEFLSSEIMPVNENGRFTWSDQLSMDLDE